MEKIKNGKFPKVFMSNYIDKSSHDHYHQSLLVKCRVYQDCMYVLFHFLASLHLFQFDLILRNNFSFFNNGMRKMKGFCC